ncbi:MAG: tetratricopeptide repeat protein [Bacteroidales bacterium]|nr:tetratricopeptide repeat protein [Bacteroidales bacterium]
MNTNSPKYTKMIDNYLSGELSADKMRSFEAELLINPELRMELQLEKDLIKILSDEDALNLRRKLNLIMNEAKRPKTINLKSSRSFMKIAATIVVIMGLISIWSITNQNTATNDELFMQYYATDNNLGAYRSGEVELVEAIRFYQVKEFEQAIISFENFLITQPGNIAVHFYTGISYIEVDRFDDAIKEFNFIIDDNKNLYIEHAEWYLGLCYLKKDENTKAIEKFTEIANNKKSFYQKDASRILKELQLKK